MIFDLHSDLLYIIDMNIREGNLNTYNLYNKEKLDKGKALGCISVLYYDEGKTGHKDELITMIKNISKEFNNYKNNIVFRKSISDFDLDRKDLYQCILGIEGLSGLQGDIDYIDVLYNYGLRHVGITWNEPNDFATGVLGDIDSGLTPLGEKLVKKCNDMGIIIDVSHLNVKSFYDVMKVTTKPIIASHSNPMSLCSAKRNLTDDQLKEIKNSGGIVGANTIPVFIQDHVDKNPSLSEFVDHIEYMIDKMGIEHVGFGFDFLDNIPNEHRKYVIEGFKDISETGNLINEIKKRGYSDKDIELLSYKNALRVMKDIIGR